MYFVLRSQTTGNIVENRALTVTGSGNIISSSLQSQGGGYAALYSIIDQIVPTGALTQVTFGSSFTSGVPDDIIIVGNTFVIQRNGRYLLSGQITVEDPALSVVPYAREVDVVQTGSLNSIIARAHSVKEVATGNVDSIPFSVLVSADAGDSISISYLQASTQNQLVKGVALPNKLSFMQLTLVSNPAV